eukprot:1802807-Amphidinium_carterae.1
MNNVVHLSLRGFLPASAVSGLRVDTVVCVRVRVRVRVRVCVCVSVCQCERVRSKMRSSCGLRTLQVLNALLDFREECIVALGNPLEIASSKT